MVSTSNTNNYCPDGETEKYEIVHFYSHAPKLKNYLKRTLQRVWSQATILGRIKWNREFAYPRIKDDAARRTKQAILPSIFDFGGAVACSQTLCFLFKVSRALSPSH